MSVLHSCGTCDAFFYAEERDGVELCDDCEGDEMMSDDETSGALLGKRSDGERLLGAGYTVNRHGWWRKGGGPALDKGTALRNLDKPAPLPPTRAERRARDWREWVAERGDTGIHGEATEDMKVAFVAGWNAANDRR